MKCSKCDVKITGKLKCFYCGEKFCIDCFTPHAKVQCIVTDDADQGALDSEADMDDLYGGFSD